MGFFGHLAFKEFGEGLRVMARASSLGLRAWVRLGCDFFGGKCRNPQQVLPFRLQVKPNLHSPLRSRATTIIFWEPTRRIDEASYQELNLA